MCSLYMGSIPLEDPTGYTRLSKLSRRIEFVEVADGGPRLVGRICARAKSGGGVVKVPFILMVISFMCSRLRGFSMASALVSLRSLEACCKGEAGLSSSLFDGGSMLPFWASLPLKTSLLFLRCVASTPCKKVMICCMTCSWLTTVFCKPMTSCKSIE